MSSMTEPDHAFSHIPVMSSEVMHYLDPQPGEVMLDATVGGAGHSMLIAQRIIPGGSLIGFDRDQEALNAASSKLKELSGELELILKQTSFGDLDNVLTMLLSNKEQVLDGALFDVGVSSHQLDSQRGFSFQRDEPLDMRMDRSSGVTAAELLQKLSEQEIASVLWEFGEERFSRQIARNIVEARERNGVKTTGQLTSLVQRSVPVRAWPKEIHVATRTFQAVRIAVNNELDQLKLGITAAIKRLKPAGRIVVITFHSLEDRIVKQLFKEAAGLTAGPSGSSPAVFLPRNSTPTMKLLTIKPISASESERHSNPRARSAHLRAAIKLPLNIT